MRGASRWLGLIHANAQSQTKHTRFLEDLQRKAKSHRVADGFMARECKTLDFANAEPQVFDSIFRWPIGTEAIAIRLELGLGDGSVCSTEVHEHGIARTSAKPISSSDNMARYRTEMVARTCFFSSSLTVW
jgi:hypothetical protein